MGSLHRETAAFAKIMAECLPKPQESRAQSSWRREDRAERHILAVWTAVNMWISSWHVDSHPPACNEPGSRTVLKCRFDRTGWSGGYPEAEPSHTLVSTLPYGP